MVQRGFCSLHCAAANLAVSLDKTPKSIRGADLESKQLINAESATWVVGGRLKGVMTRQGKWAFLSRERAEAFLKDLPATAQCPPTAQLQHNQIEKELSHVA
jgi:hypothetical protein